MQVVKIDFRASSHREALVRLLDVYARDIMGGGKPLAESVRISLPDALAERPFVHGFLVFADQVAIGLALCMEGFSTFTCKPLLNIHDLMVMPEYRNRGIAGHLLAAIEEFARSLHCCKITLEVLEGNAAAQQAYEKFGFEPYQLDPDMGRALFWEKPLND